MTGIAAYNESFKPPVKSDNGAKHINIVQQM